MNFDIGSIFILWWEDTRVSVTGGYPGPFLRDLQGLILYSLVYNVELPNSVPGPKGNIDLNALATEMLAMEGKTELLEDIVNPCEPDRLKAQMRVNTRFSTCYIARPDHSW